MSGRPALWSVFKMVKRLKQYCKNCGGMNMTTQGWLARNMDKQTWEFTGEFSDLYDWCDDSNEETKIYETEIS